MNLLLCCYCSVMQDTACSWAQHLRVIVDILDQVWERAYRDTLLVFILSPIEERRALPEVHAQSQNTSLGKPKWSLGGGSGGAPTSGVGV